MKLKSSTLKGTYYEFVNDGHSHCSNIGIWYNRVPLTQGQAIHHLQTAIEPRIKRWLQHKIENMPVGEWL